MKVKVAIARKMLTAIWFILRYKIQYKDYTSDIAPAARNDRFEWLGGRTLVEIYRGNVYKMRDS